jgi:hypothetical protein
MAIKDYFFNAIKNGDVYDRVYNAEDVTSYLDKIVSNGVFPTPSTCLQVQRAGGMNVSVGAGQGWINGHKMISTSTITLTVDPSDVLLSRIDNVVFYVDLIERAMGVMVKKGTNSASNPRPPQLVRTEQRYELCLAQIAVNKQVTNITAAMITDTRGNSNLCGYVTGLIRQVDTTTLFEQWDDAFHTWFDEVKEEMASATLVRKYEANYVTQTAYESTFDIKTLIPQYGYALDILEVRINGLTLANNEYTQSESTITLVTPIEHVGTPISFVIYKSIDGSQAESVVDAVVELQGKVDALQAEVDELKQG